MTSNEIEKIPPERSILETVGKSDLSSLSVDAGEAILDQLLQEGIIRELPVIKSLINLTKVGLTIRDYLFFKKTLRFLYHIKDIPTEKREKFSRQLEVDPIFRKQIGNNLILLLNRLDDMQKPDLLGRVFKAYIVGRIDYQTYQKLAVAIDRVKISSLQGLVKFYCNFDGNNFDRLMEHPSLAHDIIQDLIMCGLIDIRFMPGVVTYNANFESGVTQIGKLFIEIALEENKTI